MSGPYEDSATKKLASPGATLELRPSNAVNTITIPNHDPIKIGTLASILDDVAGHFSITRQDLIQKIDI